MAPDRLRTFSLLYRWLAAMGCPGRTRLHGSSDSQSGSRSKHALLRRHLGRLIEFDQRPRIYNSGYFFVTVATALHVTASHPLFTRNSWLGGLFQLKIPGITNFEKEVIRMRVRLAEVMRLQQRSELPPFRLRQDVRVCSQHLNADMICAGGVMLANSASNGVEVAPGDDRVDQAIAAAVPEIVFIKAER